MSGCQLALIKNIELLDEKGEEYLGRRWTKRIKEIYFNVDKESIVIVIDESFQWTEERQEELDKEETKKKKENLENKVNLLLK